MSTRVKDAGEFFQAEIATFDRFWQCQFRARSSRAFKPVTLVRRAPKMWILLSSRRISILFLTQNNQAFHVDTAAGDGRSSAIGGRARGERLNRGGSFGETPAE
jgi:hypothetical protein